MDNIDFFNKAFFTVLLISVAIEIVYAISPQVIKKQFEYVDYPPNYKGLLCSVSLSASLAFFFIGLLLLFIVQVNVYAIPKEHRADEHVFEKEMRHREKWMSEASLY